MKKDRKGELVMQQNNTSEFKKEIVRLHEEEGRTYWSIRREIGFWLGAEFVPAKAENAGGLAPVKETNAGRGKLCPRQSSISCRIGHYKSITGEYGVSKASISKW